MNECRQPVRDDEVGHVPVIAIQLQRDESQCICAEGKKLRGRGHNSVFACQCVYVIATLSELQSCG